MAFSRTAALEYLQRAHQQNRLAHAYLISGPPGSGKQLLAAELASLVNGTNANDVFSSKAREIFVARPESRSRRIVISQIRELEHALHMRALNGRRKVAIISEADRLQPQAANAFLKTLEEPPKDSLLLLLSALPEALPDTILSRCIPIPLAPNGEHKNKLEEEKLVKLLQQTAREQSWTVQYAYRLAQGFQRLLRLSREQIKAETDEALKGEEARYKNSTDGAWLEEREEYYKALFFEPPAMSIAEICRMREKKSPRSRSALRRRKSCARSGGWKNYAINLAAISRKHSPSKLHSSEFSPVERRPRHLRHVLIRVKILG
jgi:DNA polymerase-3 subunit delta'